MWDASRTHVKHIWDACECHLGAELYRRLACCETNTVEPVYSGHLGTSPKCPKYQGVQVSLHVNGYFITITKCSDYGGVPIIKFPD